MPASMREFDWYTVEQNKKKKRKAEEHKIVTIPLETAFGQEEVLYPTALWLDSQGMAA